jgi:hypothetical protein
MRRSFAHSVLGQKQLGEAVGAGENATVAV